MLKCFLSMWITLKQLIVYQLLIVLSFLDFLFFFLLFQADYYAHPEHYNPVFHEKIAPYASVIGMWYIPAVKLLFPVKLLYLATLVNS